MYFILGKWSTSSSLWGCKIRQSRVLCKVLHLLYTGRHQIHTVNFYLPDYLPFFPRILYPKRLSVWMLVWKQRYLFTLLSALTVDISFFDQVNSSSQMELKACERLLSSLIACGVLIRVFATDRSTSIRSMMIKNHPLIKHQFDPWYQIHFYTLRY